VRSRPVRMLGNGMFLVLPVVLAIAAGSAALTSRAWAVDPAAPYSLSGRTQGAVPVPYWVDSRFTPREAEAVCAAFAQWQHDSGSRVTFTYMGTIVTSDASSDDSRNVVVRSAEPLPRNRGETIAITVRRQRENVSGASGDGVYSDVDIVVDFSGRMAWSTTGETGAYDLQSVATHEIGHLLGLDDVSDPAQVMCRIQEPGQIGRRYLRSGDLEGLAQAYPTVETAHAETP
jgi:hypothetical protein